MAETSRPWQGITQGDPGPYSATQWRQVWARGMAFAGQNANYGPLRGVDNELEVTATNPVSNQVTLGSGAAIVQGAWYYNSADVNITIQANGSGNPRIDLIILQVDYVAQTVRYSTLQGTPAVSPAIPNLTQSAGTLWQIPLAQIAVASGFATIASTDIIDRREYANAPDSVFVEVINQAASVLNKGAVVIHTTSPTGMPMAVTTTTTKQARGVAGIVESRVAAAGGLIRACVQGITPVTVDTSVVAGDYLVTATTAGQSTKTATGNTGWPHAFVLTSAGAGENALCYVNVLPNHKNPVMPAFHAFSTADQTVTAGVLTKIDWDSEAFDTAGWFDLAVDRFTPLEPGYYNVYAYAATNGGGVQIQLNGAAIANGTNISGAGSEFFAYTSVQTAMNGSTDYLEAYATSTSTTVALTLRRGGFGAVKVSEMS